MRLVDELARAQPTAWINAAVFGVLAVASLAATVTWFTLLSNSRMLPLLFMVLFWVVQTCVAATAAVSWVQQARALRALQEAPDARGPLASLWSAHRLLWQALTVGAIALASALCIALPLTVDEFWS